MSADESDDSGRQSQLSGASEIRALAEASWTPMMVDIAPEKQHFLIFIVFLIDSSTEEIEHKEPDEIDTTSWNPRKKPRKGDDLNNNIACLKIKKKTSNHPLFPKDQVLQKLKSNENSEESP